MKIDFVSDIACPWCAVGLNSLERALERLGDEVSVQLHFQPFELNPQMPPEGVDTVQHLSRKYGLAPDQLAKNREALRERGASVGFTFGERPRIWNTFDAHRLLHWAGLVGAERQRALKHALLGAYHTDGDNPGDAAVLLRAAKQAGLDETEAQDVIASGRYSDEVRAAQRHWQELGIHAVPSVIIDGQHLIQGGQPPEVFERALRQLAGQAESAR
jgi:predicted DsbA family dithiol-disulfide isomerase